MMRLFKKPGVPSGLPLAQHMVSQDLGDHSSDELRQVISDLETVIAEHETTNAFLKDLLTQRWFEAPVDERDDTRSLQYL